MSRFGDRINALRRRRHITQRQFAERADIALSTIWRAIKKVHGPDDIHPSTFQALAKGLGMEPHELHAELEGDGLPAGSDFDPSRMPSHKRHVGIPVIGSVVASLPLDTDLNLAAEEWLPASLYPFPQERPAALRAMNNSMSPLILEKDLVVIARKFWRLPKTGDIVVYTRIQDEDHSIKHLQILDDGSWQLIPQNTNGHPTLTLKPDRIRASAVVVGWYRPHWLTLGRPQKGRA